MSFVSLRDEAARPGSGIRYVGLSGRSDTLPAPPRFTFGSFDAAMAKRYYTEVLVLETGLFIATEVALSGWFFLSRGDSVFECDQLHLHPGILAAVTPGYELTRFSRRVQRERGRCVMLAGPGHGIYGHWLVDFLPKLFVLHANGLDIDALRYLLPSDTPAFALGLLDLVGIPPERITLYDPLFDTVLAEELLVPTLLRTNSRTAPPFAEAIAFLRGRTQERCAATPSTQGTRLFISRALAGRHLRRLVNRERIEQLAAQAGFAVVHPEQMAFPDQVRLFRDALDIMGEYGSALHASIFSPPGTVVAALRGSGSPIAGFLQSAIGEALGHPTGYVIGPTRDADRLEAFEVAEADFALCRDLVFSGRKMSGV